MVASFRNERTHNYWWNLTALAIVYVVFFDIYTFSLRDVYTTQTAHKYKHLPLSEEFNDWFINEEIDYEYCFQSHTLVKKNLCRLNFPPPHPLHTYTSTVTRPLISNQWNLVCIVNSFRRDTWQRRCFPDTWVKHSLLQHDTPGWWVKTNFLISANFCFQRRRESM